MAAAQIHVQKDKLDNARLVEIELGALADGAVRFEVESFSVTSNNVTYAVAGDGFGYWNFFPASGDMGIVPMWGHAKVIESNCSDIAVGERVYGYLPMATHLDVIPGNISAGSFTDMTEYREPMSPFYNQYSRLAADPEHDPAREGERMIFGPLFKTGFLLDYFMRGKEWFGAETLIVTSASSKTAMSMASVAKQNSPQIKRIGLTSCGNVDFVESTGLYDKVCAYEEIGLLPLSPSVTVDFAGNAGVLAKLHEHFGDILKYSCLVGMTHVEERGDGLQTDAALPGPPPTLFFAPDHAGALFQEHGPAEASKMIGAAWQNFLASADSFVAIDRREGLEAARMAFLEILGGTIDPAKGIVIEP